VYVELLRSRDFHVKGFRELDTFEQLNDQRSSVAYVEPQFLSVLPYLKRDVSIFCVR